MAPVSGSEQLVFSTGAFMVFTVQQTAALAIALQGLLSTNQAAAHRVDMHLVAHRFREAIAAAIDQNGLGPSP